MAFNPTDAQLKIYDFVEHGTGNGIIDAVAGAGKTTTLMGCVQHIKNPQDVLFCAFNTSIRKEIQRKFHDMGKNVAVKTNHALGLQILRSKIHIQLNDNKYKQIVEDEGFFKLIEKEVDAILYIKGSMSVSAIRDIQEKRISVESMEEKYQFNTSLFYLNCIIKFLLEINDKFRLTLCTEDIESYREMIDHFGIFEKERRYTLQFAELEHYVKAHKILLKEGNEMANSLGIIDFVDMLYQPHLLNLHPNVQYGFVFVDECQDLSRAQIEIVQKYVKPTGRVLAVGDPYQSIYGFAGADSQSFNRVLTTFNCQRLSLTDCFRCPTKAIDIAKKIREDIKGFKKEGGIVEVLQNHEVLRRLKPGDLVICRFRDPLRMIAMKLVNKNVKVHMHPDEVQEFIGDYKAYFTPGELMKKLNEGILEEFFANIEQRNVKRFEKDFANVDSAIKSVKVKEATDLLRESIDFFRLKFIDWQLNTIDSILLRLKETLQYLGDDAIKISTIHRAKGLEENRVFILEYNKLPVPRSKQWEKEQERNLHYVAVTRPKQELYLCLEKREEDEVDEKDEEATASATTVTSTSSILFATDIREWNFIKILPITAIQNIPKKFYQFGVIEDTPYVGVNRLPFQKAKYWAICEAIEESEYNIENVISTNYLDTYVLSSPIGTRIYDGHYKASGAFHFTPRETNYPDNDVIMPYLSNESNYPIQFEYKPQNDGFEAAHTLITAGCKELEILNTNIFKEGYNIVYCLKTTSSYAYLKLTFNKRGIITTLMPFSTLGKEDTALSSLLEIISHLWQA
ncbi:MAG: ATP-dependent helicase [Bacteroidaceae bacterium]|nr:ATP-dependent helicase [Bacteroidaceae bacterium]